MTRRTYLSNTKSFQTKGKYDSWTGTLNDKENLVIKARNKRGVESARKSINTRVYEEARIRSICRHVLSSPGFGRECRGDTQAELSAVTPIVEILVERTA